MIHTEKKKNTKKAIIKVKMVSRKHTFLKLKTCLLFNTD